MRGTSYCSEPPIDAAEQHRVGALLMGAVAPTEWRPAYRQHAVMIDALERVRARVGGAQVVDLGLVLDELHEAESDWPWAIHIDLILREWDRVEDTVTERREAQRDTIRVYGLILDAEQALEDRVDDLLAARAAAEHALETLNLAYSTFEARARDVLRSAA